MKVIVTGATGYIGESVVHLLQKRGHTVVCMSRRKPNNLGIVWVPYDMEQIAIDETEHLLCAGAIIHLAATTSPENHIDTYPDLNATKQLLLLSNRLNAKFIFISSQTARDDTPTNYGRLKLAIEKEVNAFGGIIIRPGQVYGGMPKGLFGTLVRMVEQLPVLPAFLPPPKIQPVHVEDLAQAIVKSAESPIQGPMLLRLGSPESVSFNRFLAVIAKERLRAKRWFIPIPVAIIKLAIDCSSKLLGKPTFLNRLQSLFDLHEMKTKKDLNTIGLTMRSLDSGMHPSGDNRRRRLLMEGRAFIAYVSKSYPQNGALRRYVRAVESLCDGHALRLPAIFLIRPTFLAFLDYGGNHAIGVSHELKKRIDIATRLAEATPKGARFFLGHGSKSGPIEVLAIFVKVFSLEIMFRILGLCFGCVFDKVLVKAQIS